ncbi:MAG: hypothetical protein Q7S86_01800 [bacterium]|nr:hypothetical protein [bacterium]
MTQNLTLTEAEKSLQLEVLVLTDSRPRAGNTMYLLSETSDNERSGFMAACRHVESGLVARVAIIDDVSRTNTGYPGAAEWVSALARADIHGVLEIPCEAHLQTLSEAFAVVTFAERVGWRELIICAPPFHQKRAFMSMVTAVKHLYPKGLRVYNIPGVTLPWGEECRHSQGTFTATRKQLIVEEARRIEQYQKQGTPAVLVSVDEVLEYVDWRDSESTWARGV